MTQIIELGPDDRVVIEKDKIVITKEGKEHVEMVLKKKALYTIEYFLHY